MNYHSNILTVINRLSFHSSEFESLVSPVLSEGQVYSEVHIHFVNWTKRVDITGHAHFHSRSAKLGPGKTGKIEKESRIEKKLK